jgi:hypothetical protein
MSAAPSAVYYNGKLYVFHQGESNDGQLWYTTFDGTTWSGDTKVPNVGMSAAPSAVAYNGQIYVFHQGVANDGQLWYTVYNGSNWIMPDTQIQNLGLSGSPSAVDFGGGISLFHQGEGNNGQVWYTSAGDGKDWGKDTLVPLNVGMSASPSSVVV